MNDPGPSQSPTWQQLGDRGLPRPLPPPPPPSLPPPLLTPQAQHESQCNSSSDAPSTTRSIERLWNRFSSVLPGLAPFSTTPSTGPDSSRGDAPRTDSGQASLPSTPTTPRTHIVSATSVERSTLSCQSPRPECSASSRLTSRRGRVEDGDSDGRHAGDSTAATATTDTSRTIPFSAVSHVSEDDIGSSRFGHARATGSPLVQSVANGCDVFDFLDGSDSLASFPLDGEEGVVIEDEGFCSEDFNGRIAAARRASISALRPQTSPSSSTDTVEPELSSPRHTFPIDSFHTGPPKQTASRSRRPSLRASQSLSSPESKPAAPCGLDFHDWLRLFKERFILDQRWERGVPEASILTGHTDSIYCLQFDAHKVISGSRDRTIRIWDLKTMACAKILEGHEGSVLCLRFDDKVLISGSSDCRILVWDLVGETGTAKGQWEVKRSLVGHSAGVLDLCFDKQRIVSCSKDRSVRIWDRESGELSRVLGGHLGPVNALGFVSDKLITASGDSLVKMWDVNTGENIRVFVGHGRGLACVEYSPSGKLIATGGNDKLIKLWDAETGHCVRTLAGHTGLVRSLAFDEARRRLISASYDRTLLVWDLDTGALLLRLKAHKSLVFDVALSTSKIVSCSHDKKIVILDFGVGLDMTKFP